MPGINADAAARENRNGLGECPRSRWRKPDAHSGPVFVGDHDVAIKRLAQDVLTVRRGVPQRGIVRCAPATAAIADNDRIPARRRAKFLEAVHERFVHVAAPRPEPAPARARYLGGVEMR